MGLHKPFDRHFTLLGGAIMTSGGSLNLSKGQFGIFSGDPSLQDENGLAAVSSFAGASKNTEYYFKLGISDIPVTRSQSNKSYSSFPFKVSELLNFEVSAPQITEQVVDEVILGYNGINDSTAITLQQADRKVITLELSGEAIGLMGYDDNRVIIEQFIDPEKCYGTNPCVTCDNCTTVEPYGPVLNVIEQFKSHTLRGGRPLTDFVDITPITECTSSATRTEVAWDYQCLEVCDTGDDNALALVSAATPGLKVTRVSRTGSTSKYQILATQGTSVPDFPQTVKSLIKGCEDCPSGYTTVTGGFLYTVSIVDDGADVSTTIETLANASAGTGVQQSTIDGIGFYTVVLTAELSSGNLATFVAANPTATVTKIGLAADACTDSTVTNIAWAVCGTCNVSSDTYQITIPDDCSGSVLAELQDFYPGLTIIEALDPSKTEATVTLTGTSGTATITIGANTYTVTFDTDLTTTADNFVTAEAANILANDGLTLTASAGVLTLISSTIAAGTSGISIANDTGDLAGTVVDTSPLFAAGCQRVYETTVITNLVCDECDDIYKDSYISEAPGKYMNRSWVLTSPTQDDYTGCKMGIRVKGKLLQVFADECVRDMGFIDSSVKVRMSGGHLTEVREGIGATEDVPFNVEYLSQWKPRTHMGGNLYQFEESGRIHFKGEPSSDPSDNIRKIFKGDSSSITPDAQYMDYALTVKREISSQSFASTHQDNIIFHVLVEVGRHQEVEALLNSLAMSAGLDPVVTNA